MAETINHIQEKKIDNLNNIINDILEQISIAIITKDKKSEIILKEIYSILIQKKKLLTTQETKNKLNINSLFNHINNGYDKYTEKLEKKGLSKNTKKIIIDGIYKKLLNKVISIKGKKIIFTKEYIEQNKEKFIKNITKFLIVLMNIESYGGKDVENEESSAKGPLQWIDGWKNNKKYSEYNRKKGVYSPFETALRRYYIFFSGKKYPNFDDENIPKYIRNAWNNGGKLLTKEFDTEKQIQLWYIDLIMRGKTAQKLLAKMLLGDINSGKEIYRKYHHTSSTKNIDKIINNHFKYFIASN